MFGLPASTWLWLAPLIVWSLVWKGMALWRAAKNGDRVWYIVMLVVNTAGILEIIYIRAFSRKPAKPQAPPAPPAP